MSDGKGTRQEAELLHGLVARRLRERLESDDFSPTDLRNAMDWLHRHGITKFVGDTAESLEDGVGMTGPDLPPLQLLDEEEDAA